MNIEYIITNTLYGLLLLVMTISMSIGVIYFERRFSALMQDRIGPNRVGPFGLLQLAADTVKLFFKEDRLTANSDRFLSYLGPVLAFIPGAIILATLPLGTLDGHTSIVFADVNMGIVFALAISTYSAYGLAYGGWASNSKYSLLGGMRSSAQIISFEIAMGLSVIALILSVGNVTFHDMVMLQVSDQGNRDGGEWFWWAQPLAFIIFLISAFAETNRAPFDFPEAEQELVGGYHTEYPAMKFATYMFGEYIAMIAMSFLLAIMFFGGWDMGIDTWLFPYLGWIDSGSTIYQHIASTCGESGCLAGGAFWNAILSVGVILFKVWIILLIFVWVRWTIPRLKWFQLMKMGWSVLIPLAIANIILTAIIRYLVDTFAPGIW